MSEIIEIKGEDILTPGFRVMCILLLPIIAFVQFFFPYSLPIAIVIAIVLLFVGFTGFNAHYVYQCDLDNKLYRKCSVVLGRKSGKWLELNPNCQYVSFQLFSQKYSMNFMNMYSTETNEDLFVVRLVNTMGTYTTLAETTDYKLIPQCLELCKKLSEKFNVPFQDFVKSLVLKKRRK